MKKSHLVILLMLILIFSLLIINSKPDVKIENTLTFKEKLSDYHLFEGEMAELLPTNEATIYELSSSLFTDNAEKQRLSLLPSGKKIVGTGNDLPEFPDGTIIAKTFYYNNLVKNNQRIKEIIETRLLIKQNLTWNVAVYKWNDTQDEAYLLRNGESVNISFFDNNNKLHKTSYKIPSQMDCIMCHGQNGRNLPIGTKLRNLNRDVRRDEKTINQLEYLKLKNKLVIDSRIKIGLIADYGIESSPLEKRVRAYLEMNCAHCHNPTGFAKNSNLDLKYETSMIKTGILSKQGEIAFRITDSSVLHMPKIGTTMQHEEGVQMILTYLKGLN